MSYGKQINKQEIVKQEIAVLNGVLAVAGCTGPAVQVTWTLTFWPLHVGVEVVLIANCTAAVANAVLKFA
jgi:hypothetical protein